MNSDYLAKDVALKDQIISDLKAELMTNSAMTAQHSRFAKS